MLQLSKIFRRPSNGVNPVSYIVLIERVLTSPSDSSDSASVNPNTNLHSLDLNERLQSEQSRNSPLLKGIFSLQLGQNAVADKATLFISVYFQILHFHEGVNEIPK